MCYVLRQEQSEPERGGLTPVPRGDGLRPRWAGAVAAMLVGGLVLAAWVTPASAPQPPMAKETSAPAPVIARDSAVPATPVVDRSGAPVDDGVPGPSEVVKAKFGNCDHGL